MSGTGPVRPSESVEPVEPVEVTEAVEAVEPVEAEEQATDQTHVAGGPSAPGEPEAPVDPVVSTVNDPPVPALAEVPAPVEQLPPVADQPPPPVAAKPGAPGASDGRVQRKARTEGRWRGRFSRVLGPVAVVLLATVVLFAGLWSRERAHNRDRLAVADVSGRFADRFLTLDSRDVTRSERAVLALSTGAFRRTYKEGLEAGLVQALLTIPSVTTEATVKEVFVGNVDSRSADVIVHVGVVVRPVDHPERPTRRPDSFIQLDLVRQQGHWLVDSVVDLKLGDAGG